MLDFFLKPTRNISLTQDFTTSFKIWVKVLLYLYLTIFCFSFLEVFLDILVKEIYQISLLDIVKSEQDIFLQKKNSILIGLLFAPVLEEFTFRFFLITKKKNLIISLALLMFLAFTLSENKYFHISISILLITLIILWKKTKEIIDLKFHVFFYLQAVLFSFLHITNFINLFPNNLKIFSFLFVIPQFFLGVFSGYLRLRVGIIASIILHVVFNLPAFLKIIF